MPGILPMKVIKVGNSSQARIAQACDRCRSKKIKCDGIRPCCSQCANVGFECKTSDKLSRRAFPRGYTESLEERVRSLESEVRELKDLLDEKDEKIDMLSKMHENRRPSQCISSSASTPESRNETSPPKDDVFRIQASPMLLGSENSDSFFMGPSSGRAFVDAFKRKIQESGKSCSTFNTEAFLNHQTNSPNGSTSNLSIVECIPPRLFSDKCVQIFWQEWAPLFPVLNKADFLRIYEKYVADPEKMTSHHRLAQLHLVFGIAALSGNFPDEEQIAMCEHQWRSSLDAILMDSTMLTLQCLILATIYSLLKGDYKRLQQYKGIGVALSHRLGLHQSQKRFSFGALTLETRKKVFWTLYTIDCFSAAAIGLPALLKEEDTQCEFPSDIDDEYITEKGFLPTLPGESSKISGALALFRASRILSKVLQQNYPATTSHDLSLQSLSALEGELNEWSDSLPAHLKLTFVQDKPSTDITGDRSALLSLAYYYIRTLIFRPAVGSSLGSKASSSVISIAESGKHLIQIVQLLEERSMSFSFCLDKNKMLTLCGLSLLYQGLDLKQEGKLMKDGQRLVCWVVKYLENANAPGALDFRRLAASMITFEIPQTVFRRSTDSNVTGFSAYPTVPTYRSTKQPVRQSSYSGMVCVTETNPLQQQKDGIRHSTISEHTPRQSTLSCSSRESVKTESPKSRHNIGLAVSQMSTPTSVTSRLGFTSRSESKPNLDYLPLDNNGITPQPRFRVPLRTSNSNRKSSTHTPNFIQDSAPTRRATASQNRVSSSVTSAEWESLLSALDSGDSNIYDAVYGGPSISLTSVLPNPSCPRSASNHIQNNINIHANSLPDLSSQDHSLTNATSNSISNTFDEWSPELWDMAALNMHDFDISNPAQSVLSFSEESLSSGDDVDALGFGSTNSNSNSNSNCSGRQSLDGLYRNGAQLLTGESYLHDGIEGMFGL